MFLLFPALAVYCISHEKIIKIELKKSFRYFRYNAPWKQFNQINKIVVAAIDTLNSLNTRNKIIPAADVNENKYFTEKKRDFMFYFLKFQLLLPNLVASKTF